MPGTRRTAGDSWSSAAGRCPVLYTSIVEEHQAVREHVGLFDIGHMGRLRVHGPDALAWLEAATTNHVAKLAPGQIQYSLMVDESGGVLDDILVYRLTIPHEIRGGLQRLQPPQGRRSIPGTPGRSRCPPRRHDPRDGDDRRAGAERGRVDRSGS